jgi:hypothetical protein
MFNILMFRLFLIDDPFVIIDDWNFKLLPYLRLLHIVFANSLRLLNLCLEILRVLIFLNLNPGTVPFLPIFLLLSLIIVRNKFLDLCLAQLSIFIQIDR